MEIDLDGESGSLLDFLNAWQKKVAASSFRVIHGLSCHIELKLLDLLTSQLDRKLISHNVTVEDLRKKMSGVFPKGRELLEATVKLRKEKLKLEVMLMSRLEKLQKAWEEVSDLQGKVASAQSKVSSLREQIDRERTEKLELNHEVHGLKHNLKIRLRMWRS